jgi:hypothetical protein
MFGTGIAFMEKGMNNRAVQFLVKSFIPRTYSAGSTRLTLRTREQSYGTTSEIEERPQKFPDFEGRI